MRVHIVACFVFEHPLLVCLEIESLGIEVLIVPSYNQQKSDFQKKKHYFSLEHSLRAHTATSPREAPNKNNRARIKQTNQQTVCQIHCNVDSAMPELADRSDSAKENQPTFTTKKLTCAIMNTGF